MAPDTFEIQVSSACQFAGVQRVGFRVIASNIEPGACGPAIVISPAAAFDNTICFRVGLPCGDQISSRSAVFGLGMEIYEPLVRRRPR